MKSDLFSKILLIFSVNLLAACAVFQPTPRAQPPIRVEYTQWWGDYTLLVAKEKGYFAEYGVNVEPVYYPIFSDSFSDLAAGQIDAALIASGDVLSINHYTPMAIIGLSDDGGYMPIVAGPEITSIQDLRGKNAGTLVGTHYEMLMMDMLASVRMSASDITVRNINPEQVPEALAKNDIQAAFVWEPFTSQAIREGAHILYPVDNTLRLFPDTIAIRRQLIEQRPQEVQAFMYAWFKAVAFRLNNPEETRQIASKYTGIPVEEIQPDPSLKIYTYEDNLVLYSLSSIGDDSIFSIARKTADYLVSSSILSVIPDIKKIITPQFLSQPK